VSNRRSFKSDVSFLEKISIGATGTIATYKDLEKQRHSPIELERGSRSFKIWKKVKIKRIRVPDILCVRCGKRVESRAKTKLEISMSHSRADPDRGWDHGLNDSDMVAFVVCKKAGKDPTNWQAIGRVQYAPVEQLRSAQRSGRTVLTIPKGAQEGFEMRIIWPSIVASSAGIIKNVSPERIQYLKEPSRRLISLSLSRGEITLEPLVKPGDPVIETQVIASVVPINSTFACGQTVSENQYIALLSSASTSEKYAAAKALAFFSSPKVTDALLTKLSDGKEHIYVKLESASSLARQGDSRGYDFIRKTLSDEFLQNRLEAVIVLGEIERRESSDILISTLLDKSQDPEIRAGAAWSLGELRSKRAIKVLRESFTEVEENIRIEAARALAKLARKFTPEVLNEFPSANSTKRPGISWALSKAGGFSIQQVLAMLGDEDSRKWISYMIGSQDPQKYIREIEALKGKDPEVYFAVTVLWKLMSSWIWGLEEYG